MRIIKKTKETKETKETKDEKKSFLEIENKDKEIKIGQKVQVVKEMKVDLETINKFFASQSFSKLEQEKRTEKMIEHFKNINKKILEGLVGFVVSVSLNNFFLVKFEEEDECFQFSIDDIDLSKRKFLMLTKEHLMPIEVKDKGSDIVLAIFNKKTSINNDYLDKMKSKISSLNDYKARINNIKRDFVQYNQSLETVTNDIRIIKDKLINFDIDTDKLDRQFNKLLESKKIDRIESIKNYIVVRTNELNYVSKRITYNQGYFTFVFDLNSNSIKVYGSKFFQGISHPCVNSSSNVCFGGTDARYTNMIKNGEIISLILQLISFLEEPNYGHPYTADFNTFFAQPLKKRKEFDVENLNNYLDKIQTFFDIVSSNWDAAQYTKDAESKRGKKIKTAERNGISAIEEEERNETSESESVSLSF